MGNKLVAFQNAIVPNTQYTTGTEVMPTNKLYITANNQPAPIWIAFEDGTPITIELDAASGTGDGSLFCNVTTSMDMIGVVSSKVAVIDNV